MAQQMAMGPGNHKRQNTMQSPHPHSHKKKHIHIYKKKEKYENSLFFSGSLRSFCYQETQYASKLVRGQDASSTTNLQRVGWWANTFCVFSVSYHFAVFHLSQEQVQTHVDNHIPYMRWQTFCVVHTPTPCSPPAMIVYTINDQFRYVNKWKRKYLCCRFLHIPWANTDK